MLFLLENNRQRYLTYVTIIYSLLYIIYSSDDDLIYKIEIYKEQSFRIIRQNTEGTLIQSLRQLYILYMNKTNAVTFFVCDFQKFLYQAFLK